MRALNRFVIVEKIAEEKTVGGLKVFNDKDRYVYSKVIKAGPDASEIKEGEYVYFDKSAGKPMTYKNEPYYVLRDQDIVIVDNDE